jgi:hypothetical protein
MVKRETLARCVCCGSDSFVSLSDTVKAAQCRDCGVIFNPAYWCAYQDKRLAMRGVVRYQDGMVDIHVTHYTPRSLKGLLERFGFEVMDLDLDKASLNPGLKTDLKYVVRHHFIRLFGCNPFKTIVAVARAV